MSEADTQQLTEQSVITQLLDGCWRSFDFSMTCFVGCNPPPDSCPSSGQFSFRAHKLTLHKTSTLNTASLDLPTGSSHCQSHGHVKEQFAGWKGGGAGRAILWSGTKATRSYPNSQHNASGNATLTMQAKGRSTLSEMPAVCPSWKVNLQRRLVLLRTLRHKELWDQICKMRNKRQSTLWTDST